MVQHVICHAEGFGECCAFIGQTEQVLVWNDDQCVDHLLQLCNACLGLTHALCTFELERFCYNANRQNTQFTRRLRNDWRSTGAGSATHTRGDKAHMRARKVINDLFNAFFGGGCAHFGARPCAQSFGDLHAKLNARTRQALLQRLCVSIRNHEFNALELFFNHVIHGVAARATNAKYGDAWF